MPLPASTKTLRYCGLVTLQIPVSWEQVYRDTEGVEAYGPPDRTVILRMKLTEYSAPHDLTADSAREVLLPFVQHPKAETGARVEVLANGHAMAPVPGAASNDGETQSWSIALARPVPPRLVRMVTFTPTIEPSKPNGRSLDERRALADSIIRGSIINGEPPAAPWTRMWRKLVGARDGKA
jgi:hypothetical protein